MRRTILVLLLISLFGYTADTHAQRGRKLPVKTYIETVQIEVSEARTASARKEKTDRFTYASVMLDSLFMHYGPHAEGLYWKAEIARERLDMEGDLSSKDSWARELRLFVDSLRKTCANESIKSDYKKDCTKLSGLADSSLAIAWKTYYNAGTVQIRSVEELATSLEGTTDTALITEIQRNMSSATDSALKNMSLAIIFDESDERPYIGLGTIYERRKMFDSAVVWLTKGLERVPDSLKPSLTSAVAYGYLQSDNYEEAIPYLRQYVEARPDDTTTAINLAISYNNTKQYDSAAAVYRRVLTNSPNNPDALTGLSRYFRLAGSAAGDSARAATDAKNDTKASDWRTIQQTNFDSAGVYLKRVFDRDTTNADAAEQYAVIMAVRGKYKDAIEGFSRASRLEPGRKDNWVSLGDCYFYLKDWKNAAAAYEKANELDPSNRTLLEQLAFIYGELGQTAKKTATEKKIKGL